MHAEDFIVDKGGDGQAIEAVCEDFPQFDSMSALTFIVESVNTVDGGTLVITSQQEKVLGVLNLVG